MSEDDLINGMNGVEETSFMDLPDLPLSDIIKYLDLRSRLKLRLMNRRLNRLERGTKLYLKDLDVLIGNNSCGVTLTVDNKATDEICYKTNLMELKELLPKISINTYAKKIILHFVADGSYPRYLDPDDGKIIYKALSDIDATEMKVEDEEGLMDEAMISFYLSKAEKYERFTLGDDLEDVNVKDLCRIHEVMSKGEGKLKYFKISMNEQVSLDFIKECFGISVLITYENNVRTIVFRPDDESAEELYEECINFATYFIHHCRGKVWTTIEEHLVEFQLNQSDATLEGVFGKVKMNRPYKFTCAWL